MSANVKEVNASEFRDRMYSRSAPTGKDKFGEGRVALVQKPMNRSIKYNAPKNPDCGECLDQGSIWTRTTPGRSVRVICKCQDDKS